VPAYSWLSFKWASDQRSINAANVLRTANIAVYLHWNLMFVHVLRFFWEDGEAGKSPRS
jgi:hypothetical protein